jgi:photosystem II stability/assembly factor-like uncharacterized protein
MSMPRRASRLTLPGLLPVLLPGLLLAVAVTASPAPARAAVGSWTSLLDGGPVWALAAHPTRRGWLFAGTKTNGVLRSTDGGATWQPAHRGMYNAWVRAFAFDPTHPGVIYAGLQGGPPAVYKSTDGGNSWRSAGAGLPSNVRSLAVDPRRPRTIYAASDFPGPEAPGLFRSTDGGASWSVRGVGLPDGSFDALAVSPTTPGLLYAGTFGVYRSTNGGASWTAGGSGPEWVSGLAIEPHSGALYAAATNGIFKSADRGRTWSRQFDLATTTVVVDPATPQDVYAGGFDLLRSTDGGAHWRPANVDLQVSSVMAIAPVPGARGLVYAGAADPVGFTGALYKSTDHGASWAVSGRGLVDRSIVSVALDPAAPSTLYAGDLNQAIFKSTDGGLHWTALATPRAPADEGAGLVLDPSQPGSLYLVAGSLYKTTDGGTTWQRLGTGAVPFFPPGTGQYDNLFLQGMAVDPGDPATLYGASVGAVLKSGDGGQSWAALMRPDGNVLYFQIVLDPASPSTVYAAGAHFNAATSEPDGAALLKSTDAGGTWASIAQGLPAGLVQLAVEPGGSRLYAGTVGGLFASADGGGSWERLQGISTEPVRAVAAPARGQVFAVQLVAGVHRSQDGGDTWVALNGGLDFFAANALVVAETPEASRAAGPAGPAATLYMGLDGAGLQSYSVP